jgi:hypothetical protein
VQPDEIEILRIGGAYEAMEQSEAYRDLMQWLEDACVNLETKLANIPLKHKHLFTDAFLEWQQRKQIVNGIKSKVEFHAGQKKQLEKDLSNGNTDDLGSSNSGDTLFRGY